MKGSLIQLHFCLSLVLRSRRKVYHILLNRILTAIPKPKAKSHRSLGVKVLHRSRSWKDFLYACIHARGRNFNPLCLWGYTPKGVINRRTKNRFFKIYDKFHDFFVKLFCKKTFDNTGEKHSKSIHFMGLPVVFWVFFI